MRIEIFSKLIAVGFLAISSGLFYIQVIRGDFYYGLSRKNCIRLIPQDAARGNIIDRQGRILADSSLSFVASIIPQELNNKDGVFGALAGVLKTDKSELLKAYQRGLSAPFAPVIVKKNITKEEAIMLEENTDNLKGVLVQILPKRRYPYKALLPHVLGYLREADEVRISKLKSYGYKVKDVIGYSGIEGILDRYLRAEKGGTQIEVNNKGKMIRLLGLRPSRKGADVKLTIDLNMQYIAESVLADRRGCIIVMEPYSGKVLAMASSPGYDPNVFTENRIKEIAYLHKDNNSPLLNRAISGVYPAASLFKLVTAVAGLETKKISPKTTFFCGGSFKLGDREFKCWDKHGEVDLNKAIIHSCDVYFYNVGLLVGPQALSDYAVKFGLGQATGIDIGRDNEMEITFEVSGLVPTVSWKKWKKKEGWYRGDTVNLSIGQGDLLVTPIQMASLISLFANGGYLVKPYIIEEVDDKQFGKEAGERKNKIGVNVKYIELLNIALRRVVADLEGTAHILDITDLVIAGKTGTAQLARGASHGWFIGFAPQDRPKIAFCVFVENAGSSAVCCSMAKEMLEKFLEEKLI